MVSETSNRISTPAEALALLRAAKVVTLTSSGTGVPSLVEAVTGGPVKGSWWSQPAGKTIYALAGALEASSEVLTCNVVAGKVSYVQRALWPSLYRVVTDGEWVSWAEAPLPMETIDLFSRIQRERTLRLDAAAAAQKKSVEALKRAGLVIASQEHTERGSHAAVVRSWATWEPPHIVKTEAARLSMDDARRRLMDAGTTLFGTRLPKKKA